MASILRTTVLIIILSMLVLELQPAVVVESAFATPLSPCTASNCTVECKKILKEKFKSAECTTSTPNKCVCFD
ncbi:hypothetical protein HN51_020703 [Arachis hypogaea]|nr:uncharacterized protein DS421_8g252160 [Arachis hypogaea]